MAQCPICSAKGEDLVFKFYCSNPTCQNYDKRCSISNIKFSPSITDDITKLLSQYWHYYNNNESEDEFFIKFFATGGRFSLVQGEHGDNQYKIHIPQWLKERMNKRQ